MPEEVLKCSRRPSLILVAIRVRQSEERGYQSAGSEFNLLLERRHTACGSRASLRARTLSNAAAKDGCESRRVGTMMQALQCLKCRCYWLSIGLWRWTRRRSDWPKKSVLRLTNRCAIRLRWRLRSNACARLDSRWN